MPAPWVPPQDKIATEDSDGAANGSTIDPTIDPGTRRFDAETKLRSAGYDDDRRKSLLLREKHSHGIRLSNLSDVSI